MIVRACSERAGQWQDWLSVGTETDRGYDLRSSSVCTVASDAMIMVEEWGEMAFSVYTVDLRQISVPIASSYRPVQCYKNSVIS